jgi:phage protein D
MFAIHVHDEELTWMDGDIFGLGKEIEILAMPEAGGRSQTLLKGEITALEPNFSEGTQATLVVRGYDRSHRLLRGVTSKAYLQVTDSDLAKKIAQAVGLKAEVEDTTEVYDYVLQHNQSYLEFLGERAKRIGYEVYVEDKTLYFRRPVEAGEPLELEWGHELRSFTPRLSLVEQVDEVVVKGWDARSAQVIMGRATQGQVEPRLGQEQSGAELATTVFSSARRTIVEPSINSQAEAQTLAQAICDEISGAFIEAEGICQGQPALRAGRSVRLTALGQRFSGVYFVTAARHLYTQGEYLTEFNINGRRPATLSALMEQASAAPVQSGGPVIGIVTNNKDPEERGRIKLKFPWLSDEVESDWARLVSPGAGSERGFYCLPEINDEVLVLFEGGDFNRPYIIGGLWNGVARPPRPVAPLVENGQVHQRVFKSRAGHTLTLIDGPSPGIVLETAKGQRLILADSPQQVMLETGGLRLHLDGTKNEVLVESPGNLTLKSQANLSLEASGAMTLKASRVNVNDGALEVI